VLVYAFESGDRGEQARELLLEGGTIAVQSLNEFTDVARRKLGMSWAEVGAAIDNALLSCSVFEGVTAELQQGARRLAERYRLRIFDASLLSVALEAGCDTFLSEDLHDGLLVEGRLTVRNPFA
jgi:predicted nucleic acid-binding protein